MKVVIIAAAILLAGCVSSPKLWIKDGAGQSDFDMDTGQCQAQAYSVPYAPRLQLLAVHDACMRGKGWHLQ